MIEDDFWFKGPSFLREEPENWPETPAVPSDVPEVKIEKKVLAVAVEKDVIENCRYTRLAPVFTFLVWPKISRVFGYVKKFIERARSKWRTSNSISAVSKNVEALSSSEILYGSKVLIKIVQYKYFANEIEALKLFWSTEPAEVAKGTAMLGKSNIKSLSPFLDTDQMIRVGGRLGKAPDLNFPQKHPLLLPHNHILTKLLFVWYHFVNAHAGPTALLAFVRRQIWPLKGKVLANQTVHFCYRCRRVKPITINQIMADLPEDRVTIKDLLTSLVLIFAGPFKVHFRLRGSRTIDVYLAVFVCFSTKAVHLELVEDLTTEAFLNALRRFTSRRGTPAILWSDNATNFIGAKNKLVELWKFLNDKDTVKEVRDWCLNTKGMEWKFIPPRSPYFGGLWEAAVKSAKYHLVRLVSRATLTYPELETVVIMVEGVLNSRPLTPLSVSPDDGQPLTPGHFLIGGPIQTLPEPTVENIETDYVHKWNQTKAIQQAFWRKFQNEYLSTLQQKHKWSSVKPNVEVDDLVVLIEDKAPIKCTLGKIVKLYFGKDKKVRVVDVQTSNGIYQRAIAKICPMPKAEPDKILKSEPSMEPGMLRNMDSEK